MTANKLSRSAAYFAQIGIVVFGFVFGAFAQGKNPVILIPGLSGSELRHKVTNERIWFRTFKSKSEDLRLPIGPDLSKNRDDLVPGDVLREVKIGVFPVTDVYGGFIRAMEIRGGYHEEQWDSPSEDGFEDSLYVFAYDWRLDCVENARLLVRKVEALRVKLKKPDLKFDIVAHSMGGLISRYAAMYGDAELPVAAAKPTWAGSKLFEKIVLLGTPNEGSALTLSGLINGFTLGGMRIDLPFVQDTSRFTIFSVPSTYQLLPAPGTFRAYDEDLKPLDLDLYDPTVWAKYGWNAVDDKEFAAEFKTVKKEDADTFFVENLERAKRFHQALDAASQRTAEAGQREGAQAHQHHRPPAKAIGQRPVEEVHHRKAEQIRRERLLHLQRRRVQGLRDAGKGRQVGVSAERAHHGQAGQQDGQGPARRLP